MSQHAIELGDVLASIPGFWAAWQDFKRDKKEDKEASFGSFIEERLPNFFGIGKVDEGIYASLWIKLTAPERVCLQQMYSVMAKYEVDCLRMVICNMPRPIEKIVRTASVPGKNGVTGQPAKEEVTFGEDPRLNFLKTLAEEVRANGAQATADNLRANRIIIKDPVGQQIYQTWLATTEWVKKNILDFFGVESFDQLTDDVFASRLNLKFEELVQRHPETLSFRVDEQGQKELKINVPSVFSLMAEDVRNVFNAIRRW